MSDYDNHRCRPDYDSIASIALRKIFIGGLSYGTDDDKLRKYFGVYGTVQDAVVMKDPVSRRSRGFGFITFTDIQAVDNALAHEPHTIDARKVEAKRAVPRSEVSRESTTPRGGSSSLTNSPNMRSLGNGWGVNGSMAGPPLVHNMNLTNSQILTESRQACDPNISMDEYAYNKIFVGGLHYDTRDAEFRAYFERFGRVISAEVMFNRETHKSRGFGFIVFELEKGAEQVCAEREHLIDGKVVEVKRAIPRSRILPNGTLVSPSNSPPLRPLGLPSSSMRPPNDGKSYGLESAIGIANAKLRQDIRRSASVGNPSMLHHLSPKMLPFGRLNQDLSAMGACSFRGNNNGTGDSAYMQQKNMFQSSPRNCGTSYATALRSGAADDSEISLTDQLHIASMQSDMFNQIKNNDEMYNGNRDSSCIVQRPPRSYSEPVIQMPGGMTDMEYLNKQLMNRVGVAALGGACNPQSPSSYQYEGGSSVHSRSPLASSQCSTPNTSLGFSWLATPAPDVIQGSGPGAFPPLSLPTSALLAASHVDQNGMRYQQQMPDGPQGQGQYSNSLYSSGQRSSSEESIIPSPSAWASVLMNPEASAPSDSQQMREQQYYNSQMPTLRSALGSQVTNSDQQRDFPLLYDQHHQQLQQQQQRQQQQQQLQKQQLQLQQQHLLLQQQQQYFQQQSQQSFDKDIQDALNDDSEGNFIQQSSSQSQSHSPWGFLGSGSGAASRNESQSLLESRDPPSLTSGTTDRDELFLFEDMRLDVDAPEFEPQTFGSVSGAW